MSTESYPLLFFPYALLFTFCFLIFFGRPVTAGLFPGENCCPKHDAHRPMPNSSNDKSSRSVCERRHRLQQSLWSTTYAFTCYGFSPYLNHFVPNSAYPFLCEQIHFLPLKETPHFSATSETVISVVRSSPTAPAYCTRHHGQTPRCWLSAKPSR